MNDDSAAYNIGCRGIITSHDPSLTLTEKLAVGAIALAAGLTFAPGLYNDGEGMRQRQAHVRVEATLKQLHEPKNCLYVSANNHQPLSYESCSQQDRGTQ